LIDAGQHSYILPIMQGFVGQKAFTIDTSPEGSKDSIADVKEDVGEVIELQETAAQQGSDIENDESRDFLITLISRRSVERAGLRYLRRGVDEQGHVANAVETEQILSDPAWSPSFGVHSFTQIRGSIPLFFSQSPYTFKPVPTLQHSYPVNHRAFAKHFSHLRERYGDVQVASLVEQTGPEASVGEGYAEHAEKLNSELTNGTSKIDFEWFDFHKICAGMKFEKVSLLMEALQLKLQSFGFTVEKDGKAKHRQSGVLRTNCMDCLDRTNVVQSAAGAWALEAQLSTEKINLDIQRDASTQWFNALWADNGDAISKQYSSTAALKGDYTRTRKRDYRGAINDFGLTLTRYYNNIVNDYFSQMVIDYLLGNVGDSVFEEFEDKMMTADPGVSLRTIRQNAIDTSAKIVIADASEELVGGWTMLTPSNSNTLRTLPLREIVLLLTDAALYAVRFDWNTEKVASFERVDARSIVRARRGTYITSTFTSTQLDPIRNIGVIITYRPTSQNLERYNTRSMSTKAVPRVGEKRFESAEEGTEATLENTTASPDAISNDKSPKAEAAAEPEDANLRSAPSKPSRPPLDPTTSTPNEEFKLLAFKALPARSSRTKPQHGSGGEGPTSEAEVVAEVCAGLAKVLGSGKGNKSSSIVEEGDIIGIQEAKKSVGLLETLGHKVKKLVWA
jgi:SacI homology domain/Inositol phosphatase